MVGITLDLDFIRCLYGRSVVASLTSTQSRPLIKLSESGRFLVISALLSKAGRATINASGVDCVKYVSENCASLRAAAWISLNLPTTTPLGDKTRLICSAGYSGLVHYQ